MNDRRVVLGLSGGVDSAVAAKLLMRDGYEVLGLYLDIGTEEARSDAISTAAFLNVPLEIMDIRAQLEEKPAREESVEHKDDFSDRTTRIDFGDLKFGKDYEIL